MSNQTCCFTGHRKIPGVELERIREQTKEKIQQLIKNGVNRFICGGALGFDMLYGEIVAEIKQDCNIQFILALPCRNQARYFSAAERATYQFLLSKADSVIYTSEGYYRGCMHKRNRYMVEHSGYLISYCIRESGGSYYTKKYAQTKGLVILDII